MYKTLFILSLCFMLAACQRAGDNGAGGLPNTGPTPTATVTGATLPAVIGPASVQALAAAAPVTLSGVTELVWLPDGQALAVAYPIGVALYTPAGPGLQAQTAAVPQQVSQAANPQLLTAAEDQPGLAWVSDEQAVFAWDGQPGTAPQQVGVTDSPVTGLDLSPDGRSLAYVTFDGQLVIQPLGGQTGAAPQAAPLAAPTWLTNLSYSPDGSQLGGTDLANFIVYILDAQSGQTVRTLEWVDSPLPSLYGAAFSPDWRLIAWVAHSSVQVMEVASGQPGALLGHAEAVSALAWPPDGRLLATASAAAVQAGGDLQPVVLVWDPDSGSLLATLPQAEPVESLSFSPDGARLAVLSSSGALQLWSVAR